jgi:hypothetical protein
VHPRYGWKCCDLLLQAHEKNDGAVSLEPCGPAARMPALLASCILGNRERGCIQILDCATHCGRLAKREVPYGGGDGTSQGSSGGTLMGEGKPHQLLGVLHPARPQNHYKRATCQTFIVAWLTPINGCGFGATDSLFLIDCLNRSDICPLGCPMAQSNSRGNLRERGKPCLYGEASSAYEPRVCL